MLKKKVTKFTGGKLRAKERKTLVCQDCDVVTVEVASDIKAVTCAYCVQRQVAPPAGIKPKPEGEKFPRGWGRILVKLKHQKLQNQRRKERLL